MLHGAAYHGKAAVGTLPLLVRRMIMVYNNHGRQLGLIEILILYAQRQKMQLGVQKTLWI